MYSALMDLGCWLSPRPELKASFEQSSFSVDSRATRSTSAEEVRRRENYGMHSYHTRDKRRMQLYITSVDLNRYVPNAERPSELPKSRDPAEVWRDDPAHDSDHAEHSRMAARRI
jgi:hypothetical protein